jgi:hypothetical protein
MTAHVDTTVDGELTKEQVPAVVQKLLGGAIQLSELLPGDQNEILRRQIVTAGEITAVHRGVHRYYSVRPSSADDGQVVSTAAVIRNPGSVDALIREIDDFNVAASSDRVRRLETYWRIYKNEGLVNNAVKKLAAMVARKGSFKVARAKKGKKQKAKEQLLAVLREFSRSVNASPLDSAVTGYRGLQAIVYRAARNALVEGDWFGREHWVQHEVVGEGRFSMPMTIQSISSRFMQTDENLMGLVQQWFWAPSSNVINTLTSPTPEQKKVIKNFIDSKLVTELRKNRRVELDSSLLLHLQHEGQDDVAYGESFLTPLLFSVSFKRAVENLDLVSLKNLMNRLVIIKVGSSNKDSPYRDQNTQLLRANKMVTMVEDVGPSMLLVWQGDDVDVVNVGAHDTVLDLDERHKMSHTKLRLATGLPEALLGGTDDGSKASGFAAMLGAQAVSIELRTAIEQMLTELGERIAIENGFTDFEIVYEFDSTSLDPNEEWNQLRNDYQQGTLSIHAYLAATGRDPDAMFLEKCDELGLDPASALWSEVFLAPAGLPGQAVPPGRQPDGAPPTKRPPDSEVGPTERERDLQNTTRENK